MIEAKRRAGSKGYYSCDACKPHYTAAQRAGMRCGWVPREQWEEDAPGRHCVGLGELDVCPGYAEHEARVLEVYRAWAWWEKGQLALRFPEPSELLMDLVDLANGSIAAANSWYIDELKRESERKARG